MCMKEDNPDLKDIKVDHSREIIICAGQKVSIKLGNVWNANRSMLYFLNQLHVMFTVHCYYQKCSVLFKNSSRKILEHQGKYKLYVVVASVENISKPIHIHQ